MDEFWVFGYGSLMWNPGFDFEERCLAHVHGYRRSLCVSSWVHRGTEKAPGLVLGLDRGGSCLGVAFRVADQTAGSALEYLRARELVTRVYLERSVAVSLPGGRRASALTYVVDRAHPQYAGTVMVEDAARIVALATGQSGPNHLYVSNTVAHLRELGIRDRWLEEVDTLARRQLPAG